MFGRWLVYWLVKKDAELLFFYQVLFFCFCFSLKTFSPPEALREVIRDRKCAFSTIMFLTGHGFSLSDASDDFKRVHLRRGRIKRTP